MNYCENGIAQTEKGERMIRVLEPNKDYIIRADKNGIVNDVTEYKHGYWVREKESSRCSECNCTLAGQALWMYCPNCGAKMDGERKQNGKTDR